MWARTYPLLPPIPIVVLRGGMERTSHDNGARNGARGFEGSWVRGSIPAGLTHFFEMGSSALGVW